MRQGVISKQNPLHGVFRGFWLVSLQLLVLVHLAVRKQPYLWSYLTHQSGWSITESNTINISCLYDAFCNCKTYMLINKTFTHRNSLPSSVHCASCSFPLSLVSSLQPWSAWSLSLCLSLFLLSFLLCILLQFPLFSFCHFAWFWWCSCWGHINLIIRTIRRGLHCLGLASLAAILVLGNSLGSLLAILLATSTRTTTRTTVWWTAGLTARWITRRRRWRRLTFPFVLCSFLVFFLSPPSLQSKSDSTTVSFLWVSYSSSQTKNSRISWRVGQLGWGRIWCTFMCGQDSFPFTISWAISLASS